MTEEKKQTDEELRAKFEASMKRERRRPPRRKKPAEDRAADPHLRRGKIAGISDKEVFVDLGPKVQGVIAIDEFESPPAIGEEFEFTMVSVADDLWTLSRQEARKLETWRELAVGKWVTARIIGFNSGGLEVKVGPVAAFIPVSQVEPRHAKDLAASVGEEMVCEVTEANVRRKRVVLSRRKVLDKERRRQREETLATLAVGQVVRGKVEKIEPFGAFVGIGGGLTGLLHVSNLAHQRVKDPSEVLSVGDEVEVQVLEIKERGKRIGLGRKQLQAHPWDNLDERLHAEEVTQGKVTRIAEFGAFVEVEPGVEGLLHISQLGPDRVARVEDAIKVGEEVLVRVQSIECERRRLSLSRLNSRGALLGSDEDDETPAEGEPSTSTEPSTRIFKEGKVPTTSTNLGDLLRQALKDNK